MHPQPALPGMPALLLAAALAIGPSPLHGQQPAGGRAGGPPVQGAEPDIALVDRFDRDGDRRLDRGERDTARAYLAANPELRRPSRGARLDRAGSPGPRLTPAEVTTYPDSVPLYDPSALRTIFIQFEHADWEQELEAFYHTDVEVPATVTVDGRVYRDVGLGFRGNNSFGNVPAGLKRPLSVTMDWVREQDLLGYRSLNLLNANQDPTFLRTPLYLDITRQYIPAPRANFVRVVINGESWGIYVNQQPFSREFTREAFGTTAGTRWKSPNNSVGGGLSYLGDSIAVYRRWYEMKGKDDTVAWRRLMHVTRVLNETPPDRLEAELAPIMDVDAVLKFLALDVALVNGDGYWRDGSDFNLFLTPQGRLTVLPHDANEGFRTSARGAGGGPPGSSPEPLTTLDDPNKALRHKLLAVPELRTRYLTYMGDIADKWLDWQRLGPMVDQYRALIAADVERDTRKHDSYEAFVLGIYGPTDGSPPSPATIKGFADLRRAALLAHPDIVRTRRQ
jgi:hypothetical protein